MIVEKHPSVLCHDIGEGTYEPVEYTYVLMDGDIDGFPEMSIRDRDYEDFAKNPRYELVGNDEPDPQAQVSIPLYRKCLLQRTNPITGRPRGILIS